MGLYKNDKGETVNVADEFDTKTGFNKTELQMKADGFQRFVDVTNGKETIRIPAADYNQAAKDGFVDVSVAQQQQKAESDFRKEYNPGMLETAGRAFTSGATGDFSDELVAGAASALKGTQYRSEVEAERAMNREAQADNPWTYGVSKLAGTVAGSLGLGKALGAAAKAVAPAAVPAATTAAQVNPWASVAGSVGKGIGIGALEGGISGAGASEAQDAVGVAKDAAESALWGGGLGAAGGAAVEGIKAGVRGGRSVWDSLRTILLDDATKQGLGKISDETASKLVGQGGLVNKVSQAGRDADTLLEQLGSTAKQNINKATDEIQTLDDLAAIRRNEIGLLDKQASASNTMLSRVARPEQQLDITDTLRQRSEEFATLIPELKASSQAAYREGVETATRNIDTGLFANDVTSRLNATASRFANAPAAQASANAYQNAVADSLNRAGKEIDILLTQNPNASTFEIYDIIRSAKDRTVADLRRFGVNKSEIVDVQKSFEGLVPESVSRALRPVNKAYREANNRIRAMTKATGNAKTSGTETAIETADGLRTQERVGSAAALKAAGANPRQLQQLYPELSEEQAITFGQLIQANGQPTKIAALVRSGKLDKLPEDLVAPYRRLAAQSEASIANELAGKQAQVELQQEVGEKLAEKQRIDASLRRPAEQLARGIESANAFGAGKTKGQILSEVVEGIEDPNMLPPNLRSKLFTDSGERLSTTPNLTAQELTDLENYAALVGDVPGFNPRSSKILEVPPEEVGLLAKVAAPTRLQALMAKARRAEIAPNAARGLEGMGGPTTVDSLQTVAGVGRVLGTGLGIQAADPTAVAEVEKKISPAAKAELKILKLRPSNTITPSVIAGLAKKHGLTEDEVRLYIGARQ